MQFLNLTPNEIFSSCKQMGRISLTDDGILCDWSASGFSVNVRANGAVLDFAPYHADQPVYIAVTLDGAKQVHALSDCICRVVVPMTDGVHTVTVQRLSEGASPLYCKALRLSAPLTVKLPRFWHRLPTSRAALCSSVTRSPAVTAIPPRKRLRI